MSSSSFAPLIKGDTPGAPAGFQPLVSPGEAVSEAPPAPELSREETEAARQAFQAGYELGREELQSQVESIGESLLKSLEELAQFRTRLRARYERELLEVALGVAKKVVQQELTERPEIWLDMIRSAVRRTVDRERIVVRVPATLATFLRERMKELRAALDEVKELEVTDDPGLADGGCVIESRFGDVDIGVETQFEAAERVLVRAEE